MATWERRGDGWRVRWRDPDGKARSRQCPTERAAKLLSREVEEAIALGRRWKPAASVQIPSLAELADAYLTDLCRVSSAQATINSHRSQLGLFLAWAHGHKATEPRHLTRALIEAYDGWRASSSARDPEKATKANTRRVALGVITKWWRWCWEHDDYRAHVPPPVTVRKPAREFAEAIAPTWEECDRVVELAKTKAETPADPRATIWPAIFVLAVIVRATGLRVSQGLRLRWGDLNAQLGTLRIRPELGKTPAERTGRVLPAPPWLMVWLLSVKPTDAQPGDLIVTVPARGRKGVKDGTPSPVPGSTAAWRMRQLWTEAGVRPEAWEGQPDHAFRKALRTELLHARCESDAIEYWCGRSIGARGRYTDPRVHDLVQIARSITEPSCVRGVSMGKVAALPEPLRKRA